MIGKGDNMDKTADKTLVETLNAFTDNLFEESVLKSAQSQADSIIADAKEKHDAIIEKTKADYPEGNYDKVAAEYKQKNEQEIAAKELIFRNELLDMRTALVNDIFGQVQQKLVDFTKSEDYSVWLQKKCNPLVSLAENKETVLFLREEDIPFAKELQKSFTSCTVKQDETIKIGGFKLGCGNRLYDETLDEYFAQQQENFYATSEISE